MIGVWYSIIGGIVFILILIIALVIIVMGLVPIMQHGFSGFVESNMIVSIKQWYDYGMTMDPDDISILYQIGKFGYIFCSLFCAAIFIVYKKQKKNLLDIN